MGAGESSPSSTTSSINKHTPQLCGGQENRSEKGWFLKSKAYKGCQAALLYGDLSPSPNHPSEGCARQTNLTQSGPCSAAYVGATVGREGSRGQDARCTFFLPLAPPASLEHRLLDVTSRYTISWDVISRSFTERIKLDSVVHYFLTYPSI